MRVVVSNPGYHLIWFPCFWVETLFHRSMGQFYVWKVNRKAFLWGFIIPFGVYAEPSLLAFSPYAHYFFIAFIIRALFEQSRLAIAKLQGKAPHSFAVGQPFSLWLYLFPDLKIVKQYVEPAITTLVGIGLLSSGFDILLGALLVWMGMAMFHKFQHIRNAQLFFDKDVEDRKGEVTT